MNNVVIGVFIGLYKLQDVLSQAWTFLVSDILLEHLSKALNSYPYPHLKYAGSVFVNPIFTLIPNSNCQICLSTSKLMGPHVELFILDFKWQVPEGNSACVFSLFGKCLILKQTVSDDSMYSSDHNLLFLSLNCACYDSS